MRDFAKQFYKSNKWNDTREAYLSSVNHLCEDCLAKGIYKPAEIVHHIEWIQPHNIDNPEITLSWNNLKAVCRECHAMEHEAIYEKRKSKKRYRVLEGGVVETNPDGISSL